MTARRHTRHSLFSLDDAAFGDEMQRRTWMEAYVAAYEVALLAAVTLAAAMVWVGGRPLAWWSMGVIYVIALGNIAALLHLRAAGLTDLPWRDRMRFWSFRVRLLLIAVWALGFVRALAGDLVGHFEGVTPGHVAGMVVGFSLVIGLVAVADRFTRRRAERSLPDDDRFDD